MKVDFATFVHTGDAPKLHKPGQLSLQVNSNNYRFDQVIIVYQRCSPSDYPPLEDIGLPVMTQSILDEDMIDNTLKMYGVDPFKTQYESDTDKVHRWRYHVVNHLFALVYSESDFIVFADADCWMVEQPNNQSWIEVGIKLLLNNRDIFIVSPNDGERERRTLRMSQQMFLARTQEFRYADFGQPGYSGNPRDYDTMPEYHAMLEGRMEYHCRLVNKYRYVLGPEYRYWHHGLTTDGHWELDRSKY
jgi:hypothetical protein